MGRKSKGGEVISKKEAVEAMNEKVVEAPEVSIARTMKIGDIVSHPTFGEGRIVKFNTIDKIIGDFGGSLRTIPLDEIELPVDNGEKVDTTVEVEEDE